LKILDKILPTYGSTKDFFSQEIKQIKYPSPDPYFCKHFLEKTFMIKKIYVVSMIELNKIIIAEG